jgi:hypothetical protein
MGAWGMPFDHVGLFRINQILLSDCPESGQVFCPGISNFSLCFSINDLLLQIACTGKQIKKMIFPEEHRFVWKFFVKLE